VSIFLLNEIEKKNTPIGYYSDFGESDKRNQWSLGESFSQEKRSPGLESLPLEGEAGGGDG